MPTHLLLQGSDASVLNGLDISSEAGLNALTKAGAMTVEVSHAELTDSMREAIQKKRIGVVIRCSTAGDAEMQKTLALAKSLKAIAVNAHVKAGAVSESEAVSLFVQFQRQAEEAEIPLYFETGPGALMEDLQQTVRLIEAIPELRFTLDVSLFLGNISDDLASLVNLMLDRTEMIRGSLMGNGESPWSALCTEAMRRWRIRKPVGSALIFIATAEKSQPDLNERMKQCDTLWKMAQASWKASAAAGKSPVWPV